VYRYGGDEFVVLLPNESLQEAVVLAERVREKIALIEFEHYPEKITASIGVGCYPETAERFDELLRGADAAMYEAKGFGGNGVQAAKGRDLIGSTTTDADVRIIRSDVASRVEAVELWMSLQQARNRSYMIMLESDNDESVLIEGVSLRKGTLYLCRFDKPKQFGEWVVPSHSQKQISGEFPSDPVTTLITGDPSLASRVAIEIDVVARARILGRLRTLSHTILATVDYRNHIITQYSP
jgi:hypothetical protein